MKNWRCGLITFTVILSWLVPSSVLADNCSGLSDCFNGNVIPAILLILGLLLLITAPWWLGPLLARFAISAALRTLFTTALRSRIAAAAGRTLARSFSRFLGRSIRTSARQLQKKYKHAGDFGLPKNYNPANGARFGDAIRSHVRDPATQIIRGTYRGKDVTHFYNPNTGVNVVRDAAGRFESAWKLTPKQVEHLIRTGKLGGG